MTAKSWPEVVESFAQGIKTFAGGQQTITFSGTTVDEQLQARVQLLEKNLTAGLPHEPALVEPLLGDIATLVDRCIAYHREASELETKWVEYQLDAQLNRDLEAYDRKLASNGLGITATTAVEVGYADAGKKFISANDALASGLAAQAEGAAEAARVAVDNAKQRETLLSERFDLLRDYRAKLELRHTAPGGAHNYEERYRRVVTLLFEDFDEAYRKAKCVAVGMESIFGLSPAGIAFPDLSIPAEPGPIFRLVQWTRRMMRTIETMAEAELEFELMLPLVQTIADHKEALDPDEGLHPLDAAKAPKKFIIVTEPLVTEADLATAMKTVAAKGSGRLTFNVPDVLWRNYRRVRLVAVGLSFVLSEPTKIELQSYRLFAALIPPAQELPKGVAGRSRRPAIPLGSVAPYGPQMQIALAQGQSIHNLVPWGSWTLLVHRYMASNAIQLLERSETKIVDFRLHLRIVAEPKTSIELGGPAEGPL